MPLRGFFHSFFADSALGKGPEEPEELQGAAGIFLDLHLEDGGRAGADGGFYRLRSPEGTLKAPHKK